MVNSNIWSVANHINDNQDKLYPVKSQRYLHFLAFLLRFINDRKMPKLNDVKHLKNPEIFIKE